jgi:hypothetical protein
MPLYKYRPWNSFTIEVIRDRKIFFPSKQKLNDPAELVHPVRFEKIVLRKISASSHDHLNSQGQMGKWISALLRISASRALWALVMGVRQALIRVFMSDKWQIH